MSLEHKNASLVDQGTEANDKKMSLEKLLKIAGSVIYEPFFQVVIDLGKKPKAVANYIKWLGWGESTAEKVRNGFQIKAHYPEAWESLKKTDRRPSKIFSFDEKMPFSTSAKLTGKISMGGKKVSLKKLPFFLRDIRLPYKDKKPFLTSIDHDGSVEIKQVTVEDKLSPNIFPDYMDPRSYAQKAGDGFLEIIAGGATSNSKRTTRLTWHVQNAAMTRIISHSVIICPAGKFPMLCKTAQLTNQCDGGYERIRAIIRLDLGPESTGAVKQLGCIEFQKIIEISECLNAVLRVRYRLFWGSLCGYNAIIMAQGEDDINQIPMPDNNHFILGTEWSGLQGMSLALHFPDRIIKENEGSKAFQILEVLADKIFKRKGEFNLEGLFGLEITTNRPKQFADFFC